MFPMAKDIRGGFWVINTLDLDQAIQMLAHVWAESCDIFHTWCLGWCCAFHADNSDADPYSDNLSAKLFLC
jgi:hypothetical protein